MEGSCPISLVRLLSIRRRRPRRSGAELLFLVTQDEVEVGPDAHTPLAALQFAVDDVVADHEIVTLGWHSGAQPLPDLGRCPDAIASRPGHDASFASGGSSSA